MFRKQNIAAVRCKLMSWFINAPDIFAPAVFVPGFSIICLFQYIALPTIPKENSERKFKSPGFSLLPLFRVERLRRRSK